MKNKQRKTDSNILLLTSQIKLRLSTKQKLPVFNYYNFIIDIKYDVKYDENINDYIINIKSGLVDETYTVKNSLNIESNSNKKTLALLFDKIHQILDVSENEYSNAKAKINE